MNRARFPLKTIHPAFKNEDWVVTHLLAPAHRLLPLPLTHPRETGLAFSPFLRASCTRVNMASCFYWHGNSEERLGKGRAGWGVHWDSKAWF
jgi:hypothetical protein